jgi:hypothetical protein
MPTRSEVSSIGERLQAVRRELREEREKQDELRIEVAALNLELAALRSGSTSAAKSAGPITPVEVAKRQDTQDRDGESASALRSSSGDQENREEATTQGLVESDSAAARQAVQVSCGKAR